MSSSTTLPIRVKTNFLFKNFFVFHSGKISIFVVCFVKNESRLNGQQGQYLVASTNQTSGETNGNQTTGRVIIAKAHPPNQNSQINQNSNNISGPVYVTIIFAIFIELFLVSFFCFFCFLSSQFQFNSSDGTLYTGTNSFFQPQSAVKKQQNKILFSIDVRLFC